MESRKGFTLIELMVVILIVGILASVAVPMLRGRIDAAKWSEGKAMMGSIGTAIRAYHAEKGPSGALPTDIFGAGQTELGFAAGDLDGTFFADDDFTFAVTAMSPQLLFTVRATPATQADRPANPAWYELDQSGAWKTP